MDIVVQYLVLPVRTWFPSPQHSIHFAEDFTDNGMQNILPHVKQLSLIR